MGAPNFKFGALDSASREVAYEYGDEWALEKTTGPNRLVIGPARGHIDLLRELSQAMKEPFDLLYVLVVPRSEDAPGRYQSPIPLSREDVLAFLNRFQHFLESDGRHHLWLKSVGEPEFLVYDRHNVIYAYGDLSHFSRILIARGFAQKAAVKFPSPHVHCYRQEYDEDCRQLLRWQDWIYSPLRESDDG